MAKDPRFNFYVDNWIGGTEGFTLEEEGAYLSLIIMQSKIGRFTAKQAIDKLLQKTRGNTAVSTGLWCFLLPKFSTDGTLYWSERLETEMEKSKKHSLKQTERINKRWAKGNGNTAVLPDNRSGNGSGSSIELKIKEPEKSFDEAVKNLSDKAAVIEAIFTDEIFISDIQMTHRGKDIKQAFDECYIHHSNAPNPPSEVGEWKRKLNTWLSNTKHGTSKTGQKSDAVNARREAFARKHGTSADG